jgi:hypothetical protein
MSVLLISNLYLDLSLTNVEHIMMTIIVVVFLEQVLLEITLFNERKIIQSISNGWLIICAEYLYFYVDFQIFKSASSRLSNL